MKEETQINEQPVVRNKNCHFHKLILQIFCKHGIKYYAIETMKIPLRIFHVVRTVIHISALKSNLFTTKRKLMF